MFNRHVALAHQRVAGEWVYCAPSELHRVRVREHLSIAVQNRHGE